MSARRRESTPGARFPDRLPPGGWSYQYQDSYDYQAEQVEPATEPAPEFDAHGFRTGDSSTGPRRRPSVASGLEDSPPGQSGCSERHKGIAKPKCTDVCCLMFFILFNAGLVAMGRYSFEHGNMKRLHSGFDFMGRMCDVQQADPEASNTKVQKINGDYVYWCSTKTQSDKVEVQWSKPICVDHCPTTDEKTVFCPDGLPTTVLSESGHSKTGVVLEKKTSQTFISLPTVPTRRISNYCFPTDFGPSALLNLQDRSGGSLADAMLQGVDALWQFQDSPRLMLVLLLVSFAAGLIWITMLQFAALFMAHVTFVIVAVATLLTGLAILVSPVADKIGSHLSGTAMGASLSGSMTAAPQLGMFNMIALWARRLGSMASMLGIPYANVLLGLLIMGVGLGLLMWYCYARRSIALTAASMHEGCRILMRNPSLIIVLPVVELFCMLLVVLACVAGFAMLLSTMDVHAQSVQVLGEPVSGLHRSFVWDSNMMLCALLWGLALLWYLELVAAVRSYVISHTAAHHYFGKTDGAIDSWIPLLEAVKVGLWYHLGSFIFGSFCLAVLRSVQLFLSVIYCFMPKADEKSSRLLRMTVFSLDMVVSFVRHVVQRVSDHAYTEMVLTSDNFCASTQSAADMMLKHASAIWFQTVCLRPMMLLGTAILSMGMGIAIWLVLVSMPPALGHLFPPLATLFAEAQAVNPGAVGLVGGIMSLAVVRTFSGIVNLTSDAVLYCFIWDKEDGVVDSKNVPSCFKDFYCQPGDRK